MTIAVRLWIKYDGVSRHQLILQWPQFRCTSICPGQWNDHSSITRSQPTSRPHCYNFAATVPSIEKSFHKAYHHGTTTSSQQHLQRRGYLSSSSFTRQEYNGVSNRIFFNCHHHHGTSSSEQNRKPQLQQRRHMVSWLPEVLQSFTIWGGSGTILKSLHTTCDIPYWACFAMMSIGVRTLLFPLVLYAAHNSTRFAKIAPDVQFQLALFQKDMKHYRANKATTRQLLHLMRINLQTLGATYKINKVNPLTVFLSPVLQIPIFWYISVDMRKIVNGLDPLLAQSLVESPVGWITDLTEADPWYGLPVVAGVMLYGNMEVALGKRNMAGEATAKADTAVLLKDLFQSLAVFMPCFTAQLPAGVQIYIVTSFCYTLVQSVALRTDAFRQFVGLPSMLTKPAPGRFTSEMMALKLLEQKARELRGDGPLLGTGVLAHGWEVSFAGKYRPTTIKGSRSSSNNMAHVETDSKSLLPFRIQTATSSAPQHIDRLVANNTNVLPSTISGPYIHGISAPLWHIQQQQQQQSRQEKDNSVMTATGSATATTTTLTNDDVDDREYMIRHTDDVMEQANRGIRPPQPLRIVGTPVIRGVPYQPLKSKKKVATTKRKSKKHR